MDYQHMTSPCGRDCFNCPIYLANDNPKLKSIIARRQRLPEERIQCKGCRDEGGCIPFLGWTESCPIYACSKAKSLQFCYECQNFPCDRLHPVADMADQFPHNTKVFNLCLIQKMGLETWAREKAKDVFETYMKGKLMDMVLGDLDKKDNDKN